MKKKLLYLRTDIFDQELVAGGSVTHTTGVIQGFSCLGHEIICASSIMINILKKLPIIDLVKLQNPRILKCLRWKLNSFLSNIFFTLRIVKLLRTHKIEAIYQRYTLLNCSGVLISKWNNIPLILEYNGSELWVNNHWAKKKWFSLNKLIEIIEKINILKANYVVVVSEVLKEELIERGVKPEKILVNPNGVDTDYYNPDNLKNERTNIRSQFNVENKFVFGFIGTFSPWHGIELLREIMPEIIKNNPESHFLLIGDGPLLNMLKESVNSAGIAKQVTFTGLLPAEKARHYLAACDAFFSPTQPNPDGSRFFGSPTKLFEYMSMAKPIIASDLEQLSNIIKPALRCDTFDKQYEKEIGLLLPPTDQNLFVQAACNLMNYDKKILAAMGNNARKKAVNEFSWTNHVAKIKRFTGL